MTANWVFPEVTPYQVQGRDLSEDNFAQEERSNLEILIREVLQNPLDARAPDVIGPVRVRISVLQPGQFDTKYLAKLLGAEYSPRLEASGADPLPDISTASVLILEDFGTTGLLGNWENQNADGPSENWNAFWFREGEGAKAATGSNGRAGQGKITYYRIGAARAIFGWTLRHSDGKQLLMGRSAFRKVYPFNDIKYLRHSFWCIGKDQPLPVTSIDEIDEFRKAFGLTRVQEPGLSLVIPIPIGFDGKQTIQTIISEFYYPISRGKLEVTIGAMTINAESVDSLAGTILPDEVVRQNKSSFTKGFRAFVKAVIASQKDEITPIQALPGWDKTASLKEDFFPLGALAALRATMEDGKRIAVRFPVSVRPNKGNAIASWFDVHIEVPDDLERVEEAYIRRDLLIGAEHHLAASAYLQKSRALTLVSDNTLSAFLADAEEPTHLKWNGSRPRLAEDYSNPQATLRAVRNAAPRLLAIVSNGMVKRDMKALAKYFTRPGGEEKKHIGGGKKKGEKEIIEITTPPKPITKPFRITTGADRVTILPNGNAAPQPSQLPMSCVLEIAYEGLDQDPFKAYDPFDFDLADTLAHPITASGATVIDRQGNRIHFEVAEPEFALEVPGFDPNIRMRARLNYLEKSDGASVSTE